MLNSIRKDYSALAAAFRRNFAQRRALYGDAAIGRRNLRAFDVLEAAGLAAKSAGSGGAFVCVYAQDPWVLEEEAEVKIKERVREVGFEFERVVLPPEYGEGGAKRKREDGADAGTLASSKVA